MAISSDRAKVKGKKGNQLGRWAWDVFSLTTAEWKNRGGLDGDDLIRKDRTTCPTDLNGARILAMKER